MIAIRPAHPLAAQGTIGAARTPTACGVLDPLLVGFIPSAQPSFTHPLDG